MRDVALAMNTSVMSEEWCRVWDEPLARATFLDLAEDMAKAEDERWLGMYKFQLWAVRILNVFGTLFAMFAGGKDSKIKLMDKRTLSDMTGCNPFDEKVDKQSKRDHVRRMMRLMRAEL